MTAAVVVAILVIFAFGIITGIVILVSVASHREDKRLRLSREAPDRTTLAWAVPDCACTSGVPEMTPSRATSRMRCGPSRSAGRIAGAHLQPLARPHNDVRPGAVVRRRPGRG